MGSDSRSLKGHSSQNIFEINFNTGLRGGIHESTNHEK